jgi:hypothetical protein
MLAVKVLQLFYRVVKRDVWQLIKESHEPLSFKGATRNSSDFDKSM